MGSVRHLRPRQATTLAALALAALGPVSLAAGFLIVPAARAQETTIQAGNDLEANYDSKLRESVVDDRFDLRVARGIYSVGASLLSHSPSDYGRLDPNDYGPQEQGIRKRWIEADAGDFFLRAGD